MTTSPAFQFYAAEYLADENVAVMTLEEEGAYIRALAYCWREGSIPADLERLSRLLKGASNQTLTVVRERFEPDVNQPSRLVHNRLEKERQKQAEWKAKSVAAGVASGKARKQSSTVVKPKRKIGSNLVEPKPNSSFASSSSSSSSDCGQGKTRASAPPSEPDLDADRDDLPPEGLSLVQYRQHACSRLRMVSGYTNQVAMQDAIEAIVRDEGVGQAEATKRLIERGRANPPDKGNWRWWVNDGGWKQTEVKGISTEGWE